MPEQKRKAPLAYLKQVLDFGMKEWTSLPEKDKNDLKQWADEEQDALGLVAQ